MRYYCVNGICVFLLAWPLCAHFSIRIHCSFWQRCSNGVSLCMAYVRTYFDFEFIKRRVCGEFVMRLLSFPGRKQIFSSLSLSYFWHRQNANKVSGRHFGISCITKTWTETENGKSMRANQRWTDNIKRNKKCDGKAWCEKGEQSFWTQRISRNESDHHFCQRDKIEVNLNLTQKFIHLTQIQSHSNRFSYLLCPMSLTL